MSMMSSFYANQRASEHAVTSGHARAFGLSPRAAAQHNHSNHHDIINADDWGSAQASASAQPAPMNHTDPELAVLVERAAMQVNMLRLATDRADDADRRVATRVSSADELQSKLDEARELTSRLASASALVERMEAVARRIDAVEQDADRRAAVILDKHRRAIEQRLSDEADLLEARRRQATETLERLDRHLAQAAEQADIQTRELTDRLEQRIGEQTRRICTDAERRSADLRSELELLLARVDERRSALDSVCRHADRVAQGDELSHVDIEIQATSTAKPAGLRGLIRLAETSSAALAQRIAKGELTANKLTSSTGRVERSATDVNAAAERAESVTADCRRTAADAQRKADDATRRVAESSAQSDRASANADRAAASLRDALTEGRSINENLKAARQRAESVTTTITSAAQRAEQLLSTLREVQDAAHITSTDLASTTNTSMETVRKAERIATRLSAMLVKATMTMSKPGAISTVANQTVQSVTTPTPPLPTTPAPTPVLVRPKSISTIRNVA